MKIVFEDRAWAEYIEWQEKDRRLAKRINLLILDISRNGLSGGIGKPEPLKHQFSGLWSRRIDDANRLVYFIESGQLKIVACKGHYS
jgi:toxin YoeB